MRRLSRKEGNTERILKLKKLKPCIPGKHSRMESALDPISPTGVTHQRWLHGCSPVPPQKSTCCGRKASRLCHSHCVLTGSILETLQKVTYNCSHYISQKFLALRRLRQEECNFEASLGYYSQSISTPSPPKKRASEWDQIPIFWQRA